MKLRILSTGRATTYYVAESYRKENGAVSTRTIERLGTKEELKEKLGPGIDVEKWCRDHVAELNAQKRKGALPRTAAVSAPAGKRYAQGQCRIFNAGWMILQKALYGAGIGDAASKAFAEASCQDKDELESILMRCVMERALSLGARLRTRPLLGMEDGGTGSMALSMRQALLRAGDLASDLAPSLLKSKDLSFKSLLCNSMEGDFGWVRIWRDGEGLPLLCKAKGAGRPSDEDLKALAAAYAQKGAKLIAISEDGKAPRCLGERENVLCLKAARLADLQKKDRKRASDPDAPWRDIESGSLKAGIPPYPSSVGGAIYHKALQDEEGRRLIAIFSPRLREAMLRSRARGAMDSDEEALLKEARYDGYAAVSTSALEGVLPTQECAQAAILRIEDRALYRADAPLCPLCSKICSSCPPSEAGAFSAAVGYLADLALSITAMGASKALGRQVSRTEAACALRSMDVTTVGICASGIFERTALTDAVESASGITLDSELITKEEIERFLKISQERKKA